jgi:acetyl esterase/lipase
MPPLSSPAQPRPLHIDFHGGAFLGGLAEYSAPFCKLLCQRTGAVMLRAEYRAAPRYVYPAAHEDAEDVIAWVLANVREKWQADAETLTVSEFSAGGNLTMVAGSMARAAVGFYVPVRGHELVQGIL